MTLNWQEITIHTPNASFADIGSIKADDYTAAAIFNLLTKLGATKDVKLYNANSRMVVMSRVFYGNNPETGEPRYADRVTELSKWIEARVRLLRLKERKMNKIQSSLAKVEQSMVWLKKEINK